MSLSGLPPELHAHIIALSCSQAPSPEERPMTHAMSLVSSYWYSIAKPFRYHSLRVSGANSIAKLLARLSGLPEHERRVRYLSLSDGPRSEARHDEEAANRKRANIGRLLALVAPSIFALELSLEEIAYSTSLFAFIWQLFCPHLASLSIKGLYCFPVSRVDRTGEGSMKTNFPRLEHLSLQGTTHPTGLLTHDLLGSMFPKLTNLEIRGLRCTLAFAREVEDAVAERDKDSKCISKEAATVPASRLPRTLRLLTLFTSPLAPNRKSTRAKMLHEQMMDIFTQLTKRSGEVVGMDSSLRIVLVKGE